MATKQGKGYTPFELLQEYYTDIDIFVLDVKNGKYKRKYKRRYHKKGYYVYNVASSFDIETTSFYQGNNKQAIMYIWQFGFNGKTVIGRTWNEFIYLLQQLQIALDLNEYSRLFVYVHNLSYEFQFMRKWLEWLSVFAVDNRKPIKALTTLGIEFRDSYILSGYSLAKTAEQLHKYKVKKLVGNLDYYVMRNPKTKLNHDEIMYCINDVLVVMAYIQEEIEQHDNNILKVPLTNTGRVREYCKNKCFGKDIKDKKAGKQQYYKYKHLMNCLKLTVEEYKLLKRAFMGGFTHANASHVGVTLDNVASYDFTSSYPAVMLLEKFPMGQGVYKGGFNSLKEFIDYDKNYCMVFDLMLEGVQSKTGVADHPISTSKCWTLENPVSDNGRLVSCDRLITSCTNIDFRVYLNFYDIEHASITNCYLYVKDYLPKPILQSILDLYSAKTELKGVEGKEVEYLHSKGMLNSCYGMMVTDITRENYDYTDDWHIDRNIDFDKAIDDYNNNKSRFLYYPWGVFVTAYARRNLFSAIAECKSDYCYSDTDSVKILHHEKHLKYFEWYNDMIDAKIKASAKHNGLDIYQFMPKTIRGVEKKIGVWDFEGVYTNFKTLGAKRYIVNEDGKLTITVAGVGKQSACQYLIKHYKTMTRIFNNFKNGLTIPETATGKLTHTYIDDDIEGDLLDTQGNLYHYYEKSCIHMEQTPFTLSISLLYLQYFMGVQNEYRL